MPSVPAVSSGEILDVVAAPPAPRGDSGSSGDRFEDVLAGASQELGSEGTAPSAPSPQTGKGKEPRGEVAPSKAQSPEKSGSQDENASAGTSTANGKEPASPEGNSQAAGGKEPEGENSTVASSEEGETSAAEEETVLIISQLIAAGVYGLAQAPDGAAAEAEAGDALKAGALAVSSSAKQGQANPGLTLSGADAGLLQDVSTEAQAAAPQALAEGVQQAGNAWAGAILADEDTQAAPGPVPTAGLEEAPELAPQGVAIGGEDLSSSADGAELQAGSALPVEEGALPDEAVTARAVRTGFTEASPEEVAEEAEVRPAPALVASVEERADAPRQVDWTRWTDADGAEGDEQAPRMAAPAAPFAGEGEFGQPAHGDEPDNGLLAGRPAAVQASGEAQARGAAPAGPVSQPVDAYLRAEVHRQVMEAALSRMSIAVRDGVAQARIQLDPPSLGRMHMEIRMQDGAMNAKVTVETAWARDAVMAGLRELRESLQRQGVSLENFSVDVRADLNAGSFGQDRAANQGGDGALYLEAVPDDEAGAYASERGPAFAASSVPGDRSINIFA